LKALSGSLGSNFSKTAENETVKRQALKLSKWTNAAPTPSLSKSPNFRKITKKNFVVNNRRKTKSASAN